MRFVPVLLAVILAHPALATIALESTDRFVSASYQSSIVGLPGDDEQRDDGPTTGPWLDRLEEAAFANNFGLADPQAFQSSTITANGTLQIDSNGRAPGVACVVDPGFSSRVIAQSISHTEVYFTLSDPARLEMTTGVVVEIVQSDAFGNGAVFSQASALVFIDGDVSGTILDERVETTSAGDGELLEENAFDLILQPDRYRLGAEAFGYGDVTEDAISEVFSEFLFDLTITELPEPSGAASASVALAVLGWIARRASSARSQTAPSRRAPYTSWRDM